MRKVIKFILLFCFVFSISCANSTDSETSDLSDDNTTSESIYHTETGLIQQSYYFNILSNHSYSDGSSFLTVQETNESFRSCPKYDYASSDGVTKYRLREIFWRIPYSTSTINDIFSILESRGNIIVAIARDDVSYVKTIRYLYIERMN